MRPLGITRGWAKDDNTPGASFSAKLLWQSIQRVRKWSLDHGVGHPMSFQSTRLLGAED
jgi:hypothetical protein